MNLKSHEFHGFAITFDGEDVDITGTSTATKCSNSDIIDYMLCD